MGERHVDLWSKLSAYYAIKHKRNVNSLSHFLLRIKALMNDRLLDYFIHCLCGVECSCRAYIAIWQHILLSLMIGQVSGRC